MNTIESQAQELVKRVLETGSRQTVRGSITVTIDGQKHDYDYEARVELSIKHRRLWRGQQWQSPRSFSYNQHHPYGMGTASEPMADTDVSDVEIIDITPLDGGPEDHPLVIRAVQIDAREQAFA